MIGIYGGSFDPIHNGHLRMAVTVQESLDLSQLKFIPCRQHALQKTFHASSKHRLAMLQLAIAGRSHFSIDSIEIDNPKISYTLETLKALKQKHPEETLVLILGLDAFLSLPQWFKWKELLDYSSIIVTTRPGYELPNSGVLIDYLHEHLFATSKELLHADRHGIYMLPAPLLNISSHYIRDEIQMNHSATYLLPENVINYIKQENLY
jgi:nicotinate-nucleotide adenylyltransferase